MPGITARFDLEFPFQSLEISIEKSKNWNGNSMAKQAIFQVFWINMGIVFNYSQKYKQYLNLSCRNLMWKPNRVIRRTFSFKNFEIHGIFLDILWILEWISGPTDSTISPTFSASTSSLLPANPGQNPTEIWGW